MYQDFEGEAESRIERFSAAELRELGDNLGAETLILQIQDQEEDRSVLRTRLKRRNGSWATESGNSDNYFKSRCSRRRAKPVFVLRSQYYYYLDLPHRWMGSLVIQYHGINLMSCNQDVEIRKAVRDFSKNLTILLLEMNLAHLQNCLVEEKKTTAKLQTLVSDLSKELYCVSSISNAIGQSYDVEQVLTTVLEATLPLLRASLGVIYFPETGQCVSFQSPRSRFQRKEDPWFRYYFENKIRLSGVSSGSNVFSIQSVTDHHRLPAVLKAHLASQKIESMVEFSMCHDNVLLGVGFLGLQRNRDRPAETRLLMISLNMIGLFLEHITLMRDLERQVKLISKEKLDIEKEQRFLIEHVGRPFVSNVSKTSQVKGRLLEEIERSRNMALLAELASGIAHQLRNPLSNLVYGLHLLQQDHVSEAEKKELFRTVTERVEMINRMINDFIQYTRMPDPKLSPESLNEILSNVLRFFKGWSELANVEFITSFDPDLPPARVDIFLINQAIQNIIKNAMEAVSENGRLWISTRKLRIRHGPRPQLEFVEMVFEDDGPGVSPADINKVLKPFYSKKESGLGLGLALVEHIVRVHGGAITLENRSGGGARIVIYLPIR